MQLYSPDKLRGHLNAIGFSTVIFTVRKVNTTVKGNKARYHKREVDAAETAGKYMSC